MPLFLKRRRWQRWSDNKEEQETYVCIKTRYLTYMFIPRTTLCRVNFSTVHLYYSSLAIRKEIYCVQVENKLVGLGCVEREGNNDVDSIICRIKLTNADQ